MPIGLNDFKDLLGKYFATKNAPDEGDKKSKLDDIKMEIYDSYLNENFERNSNVSAAKSKVMEEFFMEADKYEKKYVESAQITPFEIAKESNGHALACAIEFTQAFPDLKRNALLKDEIRRILTPLRSSKKKKSKKRKSGSRKRKSKRKKSKKKSKKRYKKRIQTGGAEDDAFWQEAGFDAHGEDYGDPINVFGPDAGAAIATVGAAAAIGGPNAAAATAATLAGAQVMDDTLNTYDRVTNNNLCECRGWHFINSDESQCNGCLPPSGLFSGRRPTPRCPSSNSCCRGRFQGVFGRDELNTVNFIQPGQQQPLRINLCNQCKQSSDEIRDKIKAEFPGLTADTEDGSH